MLHSKPKAIFNDTQGWQVSAKSGLNRGLNRFKPAWQKQVSASFCHTDRVFAKNSRYRLSAPSGDNYVIFSG